MFAPSPCRTLRLYVPQNYFHNKSWIFPQISYSILYQHSMFRPCHVCYTFSILYVLQTCILRHWGTHQSYNFCTEFREIHLMGSKIEMGEHRTYTHTTCWSHRFTLPFYAGKYANKKKRGGSLTVMLPQCYLLLALNETAEMPWPDLAALEWTLVKTD
jgi:hypothetical protein